jgi:transposase-like protein
MTRRKNEEEAKVETQDEVADETGAQGGVEPPGVAPDPEVVARPKRRTFTAEYKLRILEETDEAAEGQIGRILRREGLYSSLLAEWRKARRDGVLAGLCRTRGPKKKAPNPDRKRVRKLERENERLRERLRKAELIIDVQGKVAGLLGLNFEEGKNS